ncbi:hypothetical protein H5410_014388, partial [Solanum commersonii]
LSSLASQHLEQSKKSFRFRVRVAMVKNRNKKRNGLAAMDVSTDQMVTDAQAMDTSESAAPAMTGEGDSICDFAGKNGDDADDGFLLVVK